MYIYNRAKIAVSYTNWMSINICHLSELITDLQLDFLIFHQEINNECVILYLFENYI